MQEPILIRDLGKLKCGCFANKYREASPRREFVRIEYKDPACPFATHVRNQEIPEDKIRVIRRRTRVKVKIRRSDR